MNTIIQAYEFKLRQTLHLKSSIAKQIITTSVYLRSKLPKQRKQCYFVDICRLSGKIGPNTSTNKFLNDNSLNLNTPQKWSMGEPQQCTIMLRLESSLWFLDTTSFHEIHVAPEELINPTIYHTIQWNLVITRSLGPWKSPCYIRFLTTSGWKNKEIQRAGTSKITFL